MVCQDSSAFKIYDNYAIAVVADGHGGKKYIRSDAGSKFAVEAAIEAVEKFCSDIDEFDKYFKLNYNVIMKRIEKYTIMRWNEKITAHLNEKPVMGEEIEGRLTYDEFKEIPPESYYGTTLVCAVMARGYSWGFQIGDGSIISVFDNGDTEMMIDYNESNPANITFSICSMNAFDMFTDYYSDKVAMSTTVSTDGLYTSFGSDREFFDYHVIVTGQLVDPDTFASSLVNNMKKRTNYGTEDDISVSCIYDRNLIIANQDIIDKKIADNKKDADIRKAKLLNK